MAMTAILNIDALRAGAVSAITPIGFANTSAPVWHHATRRPRPVLVARWHVRQNGYLACHWETDISAAFGLPPD
jgi:hypothetical protein